MSAFFSAKTDFRRRARLIQEGMSINSFAPDGAAVGSPALPANSFRLHRAHVAEMFAHAQEASPAECCGLVGGQSGRATSVYRMRNAARDPLARYEAAPEDLFAAQREMRARDEELLAIYHSHPRAVEPVPSATDVQLAFYPSAIYLIIGLGGERPVLRAFRLFEMKNAWESVRFQIVGDDE